MAGILMGRMNNKPNARMDVIDSGNIRKPLMANIRRLTHVASRRPWLPPGPTAAWTWRGRYKVMFGEAKRNLAMTKLRLRRLMGAKDEFLLTATVQHLKRLVKHAIGPPPRPMLA